MFIHSRNMVSKKGQWLSSFMHQNHNYFTESYLPFIFCNCFLYFCNDFVFLVSFIFYNCANFVYFFCWSLIFQEFFFNFIFQTIKVKQFLKFSFNFCIMSAWAGKFNIIAIYSVFFQSPVKNFTNTAYFLFGFNIVLFMESGRTSMEVKLIFKMKLMK